MQLCEPLHCKSRLLPVIVGCSLVAARRFSERTRRFHKLCVSLSAHAYPAEGETEALGETEAEGDTDAEGDAEADGD